MLRPQLGTPYWLGFSPKKGRKEAAGRPCPAPRTRGWGDREAREGSPAPQQETVLLRLPGLSHRHEGPHTRRRAPTGLPLTCTQGPVEPGWGPSSVPTSMAPASQPAPSVRGLSPVVTVRISCAAAGLAESPLTRTPQHPHGRACPLSALPSPTSPSPAGMGDKEQRGQE